MKTMTSSIVSLETKSLNGSSAVFHLNHLVSRDTKYYNKHLNSQDSCFVYIIEIN